MTLEGAEEIADEPLMIRIGSGDRTAYKMLVDRHLRNFLAFATRVVGDRAEAEDVMQEAFIRLWLNAAKWDSARGVRFTTWFYRIVMNLCIDVKRKRKPVSDLDEAYGLASHEPLPDQNLRDRQMAQRVGEALEHLPERQRVAMSLCYLQDLGNKQAAEVMEITIGAMESLLVRGRKRMAELLESERQDFLKEII